MKKIKTSISLKKSNPNLALASYSRRLIAYFIDWYCISVLTILPINFVYSATYQKKNFTSSLAPLSLNPASVAFTIGLLLTLWYLIYLPVYSKRKGQTLGKRILSIKIQKVTQEEVDLKTILIRNGLGILCLEGTLFTCSIYFQELLNILFSKSISATSLSILGIVTIFSIFLAFVTVNRRMLHDVLAKTMVISTK